jgi:hypothetical protein
MPMILILGILLVVSRDDYDAETPPVDADMVAASVAAVRYKDSSILSDEVFARTTQ